MVPADDRTFYQQGDVLLFPVGSFPDGVVVPPDKYRHIVMEGEATGHAHAVAAHDGSALVEYEGVRYLRILRETPIVHEEHRALLLPPGAYRIGRVREWNYLDDLAGPVRD